MALSGFYHQQHIPVHTRPLSPGPGESIRPPLVDPLPQPLCPLLLCLCLQPLLPLSPLMEALAAWCP